MARYTPDDETAFAARERLLAAAHRVIGQQFEPADDPFGDASADYADDQLALAAREFSQAVGELPAEQRPVGWGDL